MTRHLALALGVTTLASLLLQPVTAAADPPSHVRRHCPAAPDGSWSICLPGRVSLITAVTATTTATERGTARTDRATSRCIRRSDSRCPSCPRSARPCTS